MTSQKIQTGAILPHSLKGMLGVLQPGNKLVYRYLKTMQHVMLWTCMRVGIRTKRYRILAAPDARKFTCHAACRHVYSHAY